MTTSRTGILLLLAGVVASAASAQGVIRGVAYDSLVGAPLVGAEVWLRGFGHHTTTDTAGSFQLDSVPAGPHVLALLAPELDSIGMYSLTAAVDLASGDTAGVSFAVPSLATVWRRRCAAQPAAGTDSGVVFGIVDDVATGAHLAGAGVLASWVEPAQRSRTEVFWEHHDERRLTDSVGAYFLCGVATHLTIQLRAYAHTDSSGAIDVHLGPRSLARRDFSISQGPDTLDPRPAAVVRGVARTSDGVPLAGARVVVREISATLTRTDGSFLLTGLPPGTRWLTVQAVGREPVEQAVLLRRGDTATVVASLGPLPVTLAAIQVVAARRSRVMLEFEERRRLGAGYAVTVDRLARAVTIHSALTSIPSVTIIGSPAVGYRIYLPSPSLGERGLCVAALYIDGLRAEYDELQAFRPQDLVGIEVYVRGSTVPAQYQPFEGGCGVVLVWTKYLR